MNTKIKKTASYILYTLLLAAIACACTDRLSITQNYPFDVEIMPYQRRIIQGETVEIRLRIVSENNYAENQFFIRYFQTNGRGELSLDDGRILLPNDLYLLENQVFRLYYTSHSTDQQIVDVYIENSFETVVQRTLTFMNETPPSTL